MDTRATVRKMNCPYAVEKTAFSRRLISHVSTADLYQLHTSELILLL